MSKDDTGTGPGSRPNYGATGRRLRWQRRDNPTRGLGSHRRPFWRQQHRPVDLGRGARGAEADAAPSGLFSCRQADMLALESTDRLPLDAGPIPLLHRLARSLAAALRCGRGGARGSVPRQHAARSMEVPGVPTDGPGDGMERGKGAGARAASGDVRSHSPQLHGTVSCETLPWVAPCFLGARGDSGACGPLLLPWSRGSDGGRDRDGDARPILQPHANGNHHRLCPHRIRLLAVLRTTVRSNQPEKCWRHPPAQLCSCRDGAGRWWVALCAGLHRAAVCAADRRLVQPLLQRLHAEL